MPSASFRPWLIVALLWFVALLNYLDRLMIASMHEPIQNSISMTNAQFGLLTSAFLWTYGLLSPFGGYLADRFNRSGVILGSLFVWSLVTWLTGQAHTFHEILWARTLMGVSEACYIPAALAMVSDYHRGKTRSLATGIHMSGIYAGAALGGIGGYVADHYGWRTGFSLFGAIGICYAIVLALFLRDASLEKPYPAPVFRLRSSVALHALAVSPSFRILFMVSALVGIANWCVNGWLPTYLKEHFKLSLGMAGLSATGYIQAASFAGVLAGGVIADRWSRCNSRGRSFVPAIGFCLVAPFLFVASSTVSLSWAIGGLIAYGIGRGFLDANLMPILRQVADEGFSATGYGILNFIGCVTGGGMIYAGGLLQDIGFGLGPIFSLSAGGLLIAGILLFLIKPQSISPAIPARNQS